MDYSIKLENSFSIKDFFLKLYYAVTNNIKSDSIDRAELNSIAEQILKDYGNDILRFAYSYLHNMEDSEEIVQETLIQYLKTAPSFENEAHKKSWCMTVAANLAKNKIKYNRIRQTDELMEELVAEEREDLSFLWQAVKELPENYSEVIHLYYYESYSTADVAKLLEMKESTVRSNLKRGREKLKEILKEAYDFE